MARRDLNQEEEKRSYAGLWVLAAALLVAGGVWTIIDDTYFRRPWKGYQHEFAALEKSQELAKLEKEEAALTAQPEVVELNAKLAAARASLAAPEAQAKLRDARSRYAAADLDEDGADIQVRFVKSELEASKYEYDHALEVGGDVAAARARRDELEKLKTAREAEWQQSQDVLARLQAEIDEIEAPTKGLEAQVAKFATERDRLQVRIDQMKSIVANIELEPIATIQQIVLPDFDINAFEQPVDRVDRCTSCHMGIDKPGFEQAAQPMTTHPDRGLLLAKHPPEKFGCTSCHDGQGVAINSVAQAHGNVHFWEEPLLEGEEQQSRCLNCHRDVSQLKYADHLAQGEQLFEQLGCHGCHLVEGYEHLPAVGPSLRRISAKVDPNWLVGWIKDPQAFRPRTKMPNFGFSDDQAKAVAAYLWTSSSADGEAWLGNRPEPEGISSTDPAQVSRGEAVFNEVGCRACHAIEPGAIATPLGASKDWAPNLADLAAKTDARFVYYWILEPRGFNPHTRMPSLRLSEPEARDVTAYLMSKGAGTQAQGPVTAATLADPELAEQGEALVRKYGCYGCHAINGMDGESRIGVELSTFAVKPLEELFFGNNPGIPHTWNDWTYNKLLDPRIYATEHVEQLMPNFKLAEPDILNLRTWLQSRGDHLPPMNYRQPGYDDRGLTVKRGRQVVEQYNCMGCHEIDGQGGFVRKLYADNPEGAPPILFKEGSKVQPEWFYGFLQDPSRQPLRFWLEIRMPTFGLSVEETTSVVNYFTALADLQDPFFFWDPKLDSTPEMVSVGEKLMSPEYFSCFSCHVRGSETPMGPMSDWAPNLAYAHQRLQPDWVLGWIKDPQALMPGTKMPAFYPGGPPDVFEGNEDRQIEAMRDYIMSLGVTPSGASSAPAGGAAAAAGAAGADKVSSAERAVRVASRILAAHGG